MKIYDLTKDLLERHELARNSDKYLIWRVWQELNFISQDGSYITIQSFKEAPSPESITRARRKVQELYPELQATSEKVKRFRQQKELDKGTFIFREPVQENLI